MVRLEDKRGKGKTIIGCYMPSKEEVLRLASLHTSSFLFADSLMTVLLLRYR